MSEWIVTETIYGGEDSTDRVVHFARLVDAYNYARKLVRPFEAMHRDVSVFAYGDPGERHWAMSYAGGAALGPRDCDGYRISNIGRVSLKRRDPDWVLGDYAFETDESYPSMFWGEVDSGKW